MLAWLRDLTSRERRTMLACWGGWTLDGFDQQLYSYVVPTVIAVWGMSTGAAGTIGTITVVTSSFGGWFAGALSDRFGRVRMPDALCGRDGPLRVTNPEPRDPLFARIIKAAAQVGIRHNPDYNGASQEGIAMSQATIAGGRRMSTARCYLDPIRNRPNLRIETEALTERLVLAGKRCTGVRYSVAGEGREARGAC